MNLTTQFLAARRAATPLIAIRTADPAATIKSIEAALNGNGKETPIVQWDTVRGFGARNDLGNDVLNAASWDQSAKECIGPVDALVACESFAPKTITFLQNFHRVIGEQGVSQAIWNLRDPYKGTKRTAVFLCPGIDLPTEIQQDVLVLDEPLPTVEELKAIVVDIYQSASLPKPNPEVLEKSTDALCGLAAFPAEQATAECLTKAGLDIPSLWDRKKRIVEQTRGLEVYRGGETFADVRGNANLIQFMRMIMTGEDEPHAVIWIDEAEKQFAGSGTDLSGVSTEMTGTMLTWMQERDASGVLLVGVPGCCKSMIAKTTGSTFERPTISFDVGAMKGSLVGESNSHLRNALKVVDAIAHERVLVIATCNGIGSLSPEFRRRFKDATFFCDLPLPDESTDIWKLYIEKNGLKGKRAEIPSGTEGWTGAEIRQVTAMARRFRCAIRDAAQYIVPVCRSGADQIQRLRDLADGKFISAAYPGVYRKARTDSQPSAEPQKRRIEI